MAEFERLPADWLPYEEALAQVLAAAVPTGTETVSQAEALGRSVAAPVVARATLPAWPNSAMDGYAVRSAEVTAQAEAGDAPLRLPVAGRAYPGDEPLRDVPAGAAVRIMTGGPLPQGFDTVIRVEHTDGETAGNGGKAGGNDGKTGGGNGKAGGNREPSSDESSGAFVAIHELGDLGRHVRRAGEDMAAGDETVPVGTRVHSGSLPVLAASGCVAVPVFRRPRVGVLSSGDELAGLDRFDMVEAGRAVPDTNRGMIGAAVREVGGDPVDLGVAPDDPAELRRKLTEVEGLDVLVATGGASMGERDLLKRVMLEHDFRLEFWRVRIRPGSPVAFGRLSAAGRQVPVFSLPGNPASAFVTFHVLVAPYLRAALGSPRPAGLRATARTNDDLTSTSKLTHFYRVRLSPDDRCSLSGPQGSGLVRSLRDADGLAVVPAGVARVSRGEEVSVVLLPGAR